MSPVPPPPAGTFVPSDDWTDDPSFDISPTSQPFVLPSSPSSSHSSSSSQSRMRAHAASPLRNSFTGTSGTLKLKQFQSHQATQGGDDLEELDDLDFDLPDTLPRLSSKHTTATRPRSSTNGSTSSLIKTDVGSGPQGIGTITRFGSNPLSHPAINVGTVKARAKAIEQSWEADLDFDLDIDDDDDDRSALANTKTSASTIGLVKRLTLSPKVKKALFMPPADALDDLGFDLDEDDQDQATLKAEATIKAMLPPPTSRSVPPPQPRSVPTPVTPPSQDPDTLELEADFALPLNLTNLTLATQPHLHKKTSRPRTSIASTAGTESWDSPGTSGGRKWGWGSEDSPGGRQRLSETSATSVSDGLADHTKQDGQEGDEDGFLEEEEDMESGLVIPSSTFFSNKRADELNSILDRKRKPQFAPHAAQPASHSLSPPKGRARGADDSFEDGLVLDEPGVELSRHRLREKKRARDKHPSGSKRGGGTQAPKTVAKERERAWEKQREQGWGRHTPVQLLPLPGSGSASASGAAGATAGAAAGTRERTQSSLGLSFRSNSAALLQGTSKRVDSPSLTGRERESMRSRSGHLLHATSASVLNPNNHTHGQTSMAPPPLPPSASSHAQPPTPSTSRLRHQKSYYHIAPPPPPSPSLTRKQSLASLQDALASQSQSHSHTHDKTASSASGSGSGLGSEFIGTPHTGTRYHDTTSRLTMPTSSSRAKARPPISAIFPRSDHSKQESNFNPSSSASSISSIGAVTPRYKLQSHPHGHHTPFGATPSRRPYGDGTELDSIDDLMVEDSRESVKLPHGQGQGQGIGLGKPSRRAHDISMNQNTISKTSHQTQPQQVDERTKDRRKKSASGAGAGTGSGSGSTAKRRRKPAGLIKHLGGADRKKVVGEMTWNPSTLRWEGNEAVLKDFDVVSSSARPALITHYTGSSIGGSGGGISSPIAGTSSHAHSSALSGAGAGVTSTPRIVGDMQFDPINMRWISIADEEPDPFEGMADDEDDEGATITRAAGRKLVNIHTIMGGAGGGGGYRPGGFGPGAGMGTGTSVTASSTWSSRLASESSISTSTSSYDRDRREQDLELKRDRTGEHGSTKTTSMSDELWKECKAAEERHRKELRGWVMRPIGSGSGSGDSREVRERERREEKRLWEIRHLALRS